MHDAVMQKPGTPPDEKSPERMFYPSLRFCCLVAINRFEKQDFNLEMRTLENIFFLQGTLPHSDPPSAPSAPEASGIPALQIRVQNESPVLLW